MIAARICCRPPTTRRGDEVAHRPGLGRRERLRAVVRDRLGVPAGAAADAPAVAVVPVEIGADGARARRRLAVLAPVVEAAALDVELRAVGVHREHDPDLARVHDRGDPRARSVAVREPVEDAQRHLQAHVLVGVVEAVVQDLGLGLVAADVVADLRRQQLAAPVALADREQVDDARVGGGDRLDLVDHLGVRVVAPPALRELVRGPCRRGGDRRGDEDDEDRRQEHEAAHESMHGTSMPGRAPSLDRSRWSARVTRLPSRRAFVRGAGTQTRLAPTSPPAPPLVRGRRLQREPCDDR